MEQKRSDSLIERQEKAARQQAILEKKRRAIAAYNTAEDSKEKARQLREQKLRRKAQAALEVEENKKQQEKQKREKKAQIDRKTKSLLASDELDTYASIGQWFLSICWLNIPIVGFIYALVLAFGKKASFDKKSFARGYLLYRVMVWILAFTILFVLYKVGLSFIDQMLSLVS